MSIESEIKSIEKLMGAEASEFKMSSIWKVVRKPDWTHGLNFEREFTVYEHRELEFMVAVYTERHRAQFVNGDGEDVMGYAEKVVSVQRVEPYQTRLGVKYRFC
ncbi:hypothetical protein OBDJBBDK_00149 [Aeromonas phage AhFM11]|nr:hypothetical protein OBDJBBDK_00149 [Aeromonas phage AhFM11]